MANRHAPTRHTCPDIDRVKGCLNDVQRFIESALSGIDFIESNVDYENDNGILDMVTAIKTDLKNAIKYADCNNELEELRDANSSLRDWGHDLVSEINELEKHL